MAERDYLVTARKYRPSLFREVVAQEHVTDTLKNAIKLDRLAHAYLFSGPRGVGKTTAARILAKAINCETPREERADGAEPCCECDSCTSFEDGRSLNVFEMDAASNNKVDDIRELREKVRIPPQGEQKKVYILDEVHMLSKQAFNALLKTLEEPPAHALFIFATTEPHKVLPTILSRCQRFDFRRIPVPRIVDRLREICETEGVEADEESLMLLARKGNGALRDALSAFDQALSLCGTTLEYGELAQAMGVVDQDLYFDLTGHVAEQNTAGVLELVRHVVRSGYDLQEFLVGLAEHLRNLLVVHSLDGDALEGVAETTRQRYVDEADRFEEADLLRLLTVAGEAEDEVKNSPQPRLKLETTLLKMAQMRRAADLRTVIQKVDRLEQMVEDGALPDSLPDADAGSGEDVSRSTPSSQTSAAASQEDTASSTQDAASSKKDAASSPQTDESSPSYATDDPDPATQDSADSSDETPSSPDPSSVDDDSVPAPPSPPVASRTDDEERTEPHEADAADDSVSAPPEPSASASPADDTDEADDEKEDDPSSASIDDEESDPERSSGGGGKTGGDAEAGTVEYGDLFGPPALDDDSSAGENGTSGEARSAPEEDDAPDGSDAPNAQAAVATPSAEGSSVPVDGIADQWPQFVEFVKQDQISLGALLGETEPVELDDEVLTVAVPKSLHRDSLREQRPLLLDCFADRFDVSITEMRFVVKEEASEEGDGDTTDEEPVSPREQLQELRDTYAALEVLFDEFGAEPVW